MEEDDDDDDDDDEVEHLTGGVDESASDPAAWEGGAKT